MNRNIAISLLGILGFLNLGIAGSVIAETETVDETYAIKPGSVFEIRNLNGKVGITGWDGDLVKMLATKRARWGGRLEDVTIQVVAGENFSIETRHLVRNPKVSVDYEIRVPFSVKVARATTSNGKIVLTKTRGDTEVETSNGKIVIEDVVGDISASTSNGAIEILQVKGFVSAATSNGAIDVKKVAGVISLETSNGAIDADVPSIGDNGLRVRTNNGKIELALASNLNADIEAQTSNSAIEFDGIEVIASEVSRNRLHGRIGRGETTISCKTSNGAIILSRLK